MLMLYWTYPLYISIIERFLKCLLYDYFEVGVYNKKRTEVGEDLVSI